eukprot:4791821-Pyramimonas_sp.AAC.1
MDSAEWLGVPIAGQPADIEFAEKFFMPVEGDFGVAGGARGLRFYHSCNRRGNTCNALSSCDRKSDRRGINR